MPPLSRRRRLPLHAHIRVLIKVKKVSTQTFWIIISGAIIYLLHIYNKRTIEQKQTRKLTLFVYKWAAINRFERKKKASSCTNFESVWIKTTTTMMMTKLYIWLKVNRIFFTIFFILSNGWNFRNKHTIFVVK